MKTLSHVIFGIALAAPLAAGSAVHADSRSTAAEHKEATTMDKLPKPVRSTVQRESHGNTVESVTKSIDKNGVIIAYEITYRDGDKETTVDIAKDGKVLMRHVDAPNEQSTSPRNDTQSDTSNDTKSKDSTPNDSQKPKQ
jgi:hypothetical protein